MAVMDYANKGNLRGNLAEVIKYNWKQKLHMLYKIIYGLNGIHQKNLIHCDFHDGNILNGNINEDNQVYISDLGLCKPVKSFLEKDSIYGVIPFMAPEVLRGKPYTPASDIYSFSMIMWEFTSGVTPFKNRAHDLQLSLSICKGERPEIIENTPQCYVDLMKKCWDEDPLKRPSSVEVKDIFNKWIYLPDGKKIEDIDEELKCNIMVFINAPIGQYYNPAAESHPQACYNSRLLGFTSKKLNEIIESKDSQEYHASHSDLNDYIIRDLGSLGIYYKYIKIIIYVKLINLFNYLDIKTDENNSKNLNEILESKDSQASVKANEILVVSEDLNDCIIKDLGSLGMYYDI
ncbi:Cmk2p [Rhizophagus irregularis DAOM 197198w]|uniref:Cmk2p n=1 Tax=Rhizophagus irregularis (strain DAOM 197198w) TaxID=1432141 RepID=A0A015JNK8_RHIIW|nr:Cmk2p [Rhizophagus irregularis DAOM 197198w]